MPTRVLDLEEEVVLLRALFRAADYGVLFSDTSRKDIVCNDKFCELFNLDRSSIIGRDPAAVRTRVLPKIKDPDNFVQRLDSIYSAPELIIQDEIEVLAPRRRILRRFSAPAYDEDGRVIGRVWTFLDITRTRRLENKVHNQAAELRQQAKEIASALKTAHGRINKVESELTETQQQLVDSEKLSAVGLVAASVAHDIRNILTPLTIEMALADQDDPAVRRESFDLMKKQVDRLSLLTNRLLSLSRPMRTEQADIDVSDAIDRIVEMVASQASTERVDIEKKVSKNLPLIPGDEVQIDQVLLNIAMNAIQAMHEHGGILRFSAASSRGGVCIKISDTGHGIPAKFQDHLFDPFFTTRTEGAGLGLFSSNRIVQSHRGSIKVSSRNGIGTEFSIWLPAKSNASGGDHDEEEE
jgi:two-component system sensor histidine kinase HydH